MPCAAKAPNTKKDFWFFSSEKNETNKINRMFVDGSSREDLEKFFICNNDVRGVFVNFDYRTQVKKI
jgi:hypothetical protein